ncbi:MAG: thioredoxin fold domain-containing protein [Alloalcanivorax sp.]
MKKVLLFVLLGLMTACGASSETAKGNAEIDGEQAKAAFKKAFPAVEVSDVRAAPMAGMLALEVNGGETVYMSEDGRFIMIGKLLELKDGEVVNPAEQRLEKVRAEGIKTLNKDDMITYAAEDEKAEVFVFTDITCGYCRKLHRHIDEYMASGVTVHYLAFPRGGPTTKAAASMRHIWCAQDRQQALSDAKLNDTINKAELGECAKPVDEQYELGLTFGVRGTPAIYTTEGKQLGGYLTPEDMLKRLD